MKVRELFDDWSLSELDLDLQLLEMDWVPSDEDKKAAWDTYLNLEICVKTEISLNLFLSYYDEKNTIGSVYSLFKLEREAVKGQGGYTEPFTAIIIAILNHKVRPFLEKWHKVMVTVEFQNEEQSHSFRIEISELRETLTLYSRAFERIAKN